MAVQEISSEEALARACEELEHVDPADLGDHETLTKHGIEIIRTANDRVNE